MTSCLQPTVYYIEINIKEKRKYLNSLPPSAAEFTLRIKRHDTMPSPSPGKYRGSVVRQLSLQNPTPLQSPGTNRGLKKQLSVDDTRVLETIGITCQGWSGGQEKPDPALRIGSGDVKINQVKVPNRPKPVKVAWADRKQESTETPRGVEVIATKCQGQPRPLSVKTQRLRNPLLGNKDTLVYSKLQLAERLRNAWSEREKIKPNINIFLAQGSEAMNSDGSDLTTDRGDNASQDAKSTLSDPSAPVDKKRKSMPLRASSQDLFSAGLFNAQNEETPESKQNSPREEETSDETENYLQELNKIEIRVTKIERREKEAIEDLSEDKENIEQKKSEAENKEPPRSSAQDKRANFRRSSVLHKTITESFCSNKEDEKEKVAEVVEDSRPPIKPVLKKPPLVRAFSAPTYNDPLELQKTSNLKKVKIITQRKLQPTVSFDIPGEDPAALRERIKSAPIRRKLKTAAARRKNKEKDSSDEEKEVKDGGASKKATKRNQMKNGAEIVTMVSLVSPAESDNEDSVINLPIESFRGEEKEEVVPSANSTSRVSEEAKDMTAFVQKFVSLRKTQKTVTFQPHPVLNRSYSASFPSRRAPAGTPIIIPTPVISNPALTPAQILEREKRNSLFCGINDGRGLKRKLLRSATEVSKDDDFLEEDEKSTSTHKSLSGIEENEEKSNEAEDKENGEPEFKSAKEKECWHLYQKMLAKGVNVSFDTVLRSRGTKFEYIAIFPPSPDSVGGLVKYIDDTKYKMAV